MNREKRVKHALSVLPPDIADAILQCTTVHEIAFYLEEEKEEVTGFDRVLHAAIPFPVPLALLGKKRRTARYTYLYYKRHAVCVDPAQDWRDLCSRILSPRHAGERLHVGKMIRIIQSLVGLAEVEHFMIGKASAQDAERPHAHTAMVSRFGDKYKPRGYTHMIGLCVLDGHAMQDAESRILYMEALLHRLYASHDKYDRDLSNAQSGALSHSPSTAHFTLYVAVHAKKM